MKKTRIAAATLLAGCIGSASASAAPIFTDLNSTTADAMVNSLLSGGSGITVNSVSYSGANTASGLFTNGNSSNVGIDQGIVLSTGRLSNMTGGFSTHNGAPGNPLLQTYNGNIETYNASTLTIEFTPLGNQITFSYVFASKEYPNFVNDEYNDAFVMLVNGVNRALIPGTTTPVSINTVNCGDEDGDDPTNCNLFRDNRNDNLSDLDVGGFTQIFSVIAQVNPGVVNTLTLAIGDTADQFWDSAVFLSSGSLAVCGGPNQPPCQPGPSPVSEPGMLGLTGMALLTIGGLRRFRRRTEPLHSI